MAPGLCGLTYKRSRRWPSSNRSVAVDPGTRIRRGICCTVLHGFIGLTFYTWAFQIYFHPERVARRANARWEHWEMHEVQKAQGVCKALLTALLRHRKSINRGLAVVLWLGVGMVFEACYNGWSFVKAFYFAFFALSTGGLQAPRSIGRDRQLETTQ